MQNKQSQKAQQHMIQKKLFEILSRIQNVKAKYNISQNVRLVAVSKTKTVEQIKQAYDAGQRHFGQNYVDQIQDKHAKLPNDIKWHFIGHLQSNKIKKILVPNLYLIESVDRQNLAEKLQKHLQKLQKPINVKVLIQVRTSQEQTKNGCPIQQVEKLFEFIQLTCPNLKVKGLMTIGKQGDMSVFQTMYGLKKSLCEKYKIIEEDFQLSMGMSGDFEVAIQNYSTSVRVGSSIFGQRNYPVKPKLQQAKV